MDVADVEAAPHVMEAEQAMALLDEGDEDQALLEE